jgi:hypothetical protein
MAICRRRREAIEAVLSGRSQSQVKGFESGEGSFRVQVVP